MKDVLQDLEDDNEREIERNESVSASYASSVDIFIFVQYAYCVNSFLAGMDHVE